MSANKQTNESELILMGNGKYDWILVEAKKDFEANMNWMDFNNKYFRKGSKYLPTSYMERKDYLSSEVYMAIQDLKFKLEEQQPNVVRPERTFSGEFRVRVGSDIHQMLSEEAEEHSFKSINDLCIAKLSIPYSELSGIINKSRK